jgi:RNA recognition motif-containing protein
VFSSKAVSQQIFYVLEKKMEPKLYVGNLPYTATEDELRELFSRAGTVKSVVLINDRDTGRSKGFGFVEYDTNEEAQKAISMFNGTQMEERTLTVNQARPREERPMGGGYRQGGGRNTGGRRRGW